MKKQRADKNRVIVHDSVRFHMTFPLQCTLGACERNYTTSDDPTCQTNVSKATMAAEFKSICAAVACGLSLMRWFLLRHPAHFSTLVPISERSEVRVKPPESIPNLQNTD